MGILLLWQRTNGLKFCFFSYWQQLWQLQLDGLKLGWRWPAYTWLCYFHASSAIATCFDHIIIPKISGTHPSLNHVRSYSAKFISKFQITLVAKLSTYVAAQYCWRHYIGAPIGLVIHLCFRLHTGVWRRFGYSTSHTFNCPCIPINTGNMSADHHI